MQFEKSHTLGSTDNAGNSVTLVSGIIHLLSGWDFSVCIGDWRQSLQSNFNGSNTFGTMKISSRQEWFEPMRVDNSGRSGDLTAISLIFYTMKVYFVFSLESPQSGDSNEYTQYTILI